MKPGPLIAVILGAGVLAGVVGGLMAGGLPSFLQPGLSGREERETCEAALKAKVGSFMLSASPTSQRDEWPHSVWFAGVGTCRFARNGAMTVDLN